MSQNKVVPAKRHYLSAELRRQAILRVADEVLATEGVAHLSIVDVAQRAGISRQLVYQHFSDLNTLLIEVIRMRLMEIQISLEGADGYHKLEIRDVVERHLHRILNFSTRDRQLFRNLFGDITALPKELWPAIGEIRQAIVERWVNLIDPSTGPSPLACAKMGLIIPAFLGAWDMIADHTVQEEEVVGLLLKIIESLFVLPW